MTLAEYIKKYDLTTEKFGALIDVEGPTISRYCTGDRWPREEHMADIVRVTGGQVTADDFLPADAKALAKGLQASDSSQAAPVPAPG